MATDEQAAVREEEKGTLEAIYGEDFEALGEFDWRVRLADGRAWLFFNLPDCYPEAAPVARIEQASGICFPEGFTASIRDTVAEVWSPGDVCVYSCCERVEEQLRKLAEATPEVNGECKVLIEASVAERVGPSLLSVGFQVYPGGLYCHLTKAITVYVGEELTITVDGIETEDLTDWLHLQLQDVEHFGASLVDWATAQRAEEPGFAEGEAAHAAESAGLDFLPSAEALHVSRERELIILTWGKAFRKQMPAESQANFNAGILNGRGGGADIRVDNGLTEAVQRNVASCSLFPRWIEMVISKIETEQLSAISINCTKGRHRSVAAAEILKREYYPNATTVHTSPAIKR